ncbi:MAG: biopolymer transporter ExbD [Candidatus Coatesbacteria bacterium]|nr:biopolymer transporter ExbD [Candidatus Coatesbacteria bacterium]
MPRTGVGNDPSISKPSGARHKKRVKEEVEINLTGQMNIFLVIIPLLLVAARFSQSAILQLYMPSAGRTANPTTKEAKEFQAKMLIIEITNPGDVYIGPKGNLQKVTNIMDNMSVLTNETEAYENYKKIKDKIEVYKKQGALETCVIKADNAIMYRYIISMMDAGREAGFQNISLGLL